MSTCATRDAAAGSSWAAMPVSFAVGHVKRHGVRDADEPGTSRPGMREVAERAGVAMSSVSRVLSGHPDVSPRMREVVKAAVSELGYRPDMLAQGLRAGRRSRSDSRSPTSRIPCSRRPSRAPRGGSARRLLAAPHELRGRPGARRREHPAARARRVDGLILSLAEEHHPARSGAARGRSPVRALDRDVPRA